MTTDVTDPPRLAVLGGSEGVVRSARTLGCELILVQLPGSPVERLVQTRTFSKYYSVDFRREEFESFTDTVLRPIGLSAVVSVTEDGLLPAAIANERLGLPGTQSDVVRTLLDKAAMRRILRGRVPDLSLRYAEIDSAEQLRTAFQGRDGFTKAILKPRAGSGSRGVRLVTGADEVVDRRDLTGHILEEYLDGQEYSAETFSTSGEHRLIAVTQKETTDSFVELAHVVPPLFLSGADLAVVEESMGRFLDAVGLRDGPAHTEFKWRDGGIKVIESHSRVGGDGITHLVKQVTGVDLKAWSLGWPVGRGAPGPDSAASAPSAAIAFATARPGTVVTTGLPAREEVVPGKVDYMWVSVQPGDEVAPLASSDDRVGGVAVTAPDPFSALAAARHYAKAIKVVVRPRGGAQ